MAKRYYCLVSAMALCLAYTFIRPAKSYGGDKDLDPKELVALHLKSIGSPEVLAGIKNRGISSRAGIEFIQGGVGKNVGQSLFVSAGPNLAFIMKFDALEYPGEYFAFDGSEVTVSTITPGQRSPLAEFLWRYSGLVKEGLLGGVWSVGWPLLNLDEKQPTLKSGRDKIDGRELLTLDYVPKKRIENMSIKLYFDPETYQHVRTEYRVKVRGEMSLQANAVVIRGGVASAEEMQAGTSTAGTPRAAGIHDTVPDSNYVLIEKCFNFETKQGVTLPKSYSIEYSHQGQGSAFLAHWNLEADNWMQNGQISASYFKAH